MCEFRSLDEVVLDLVQDRIRGELIKTRHKAIAIVLAARFGPCAQESATALETVADEAKLDELLDLAAVCPDLETFRARLPPDGGTG